MHMDSDENYLSLSIIRQRGLFFRCSCVLENRTQKIAQFEHDF